jgi:hypothetical protein
MSQENVEVVRETLRRLVLLRLAAGLRQPRLHRLRTFLGFQRRGKLVAGVDVELAVGVA